MATVVSQNALAAHLGKDTISKAALRRQRATLHMLEQKSISGATVLREGVKGRQSHIIMVVDVATTIVQETT